MTDEPTTSVNADRSKNAEIVCSQPACKHANPVHATHCARCGGDLRAEHGRPSLLSPARRWSGLDALSILLVFALALTLRLVYDHELQANPFFSQPTMDPLYHHEWADSIVNGKPFHLDHEAYFRAPLYPWFLAAVYKIAGENPANPRTAQAIVGALNCVLVYLIGRRCFGRIAGLLGGLVAATYWPLIYYDGELHLPVLECFFFQLLILALLAAQDRPRWSWWLLAGIVLGVGAIVRPNILLFAPAIAIWIAVLRKERVSAALGCVATFAIGCLIPILPITIRNYVVGHDSVLIASQGGVNFYIGNNPKSDGMSAVIPGDPGGWWECYNAQVQRAEQAVGRKLKPSEVSAWYMAQTLDFFRTQPGIALELLGKKLKYFWSYWEVSNNQDIAFTVQKYTPIVNWLPLNFAVIGPLGALGLLLALGQPRRLFPLWGYVLIYMVSVVAFFITARYRLPVVIVLIPLGAYAVVWMIESLIRQRWLPVGLAIFPLGAMAFLALQTPPRVDASGVQGSLFAGVALAEKGDYAGAIPLLEQSLRSGADRLPVEHQVKLWNSLGLALVEVKNLDKAAEAFSNVIRLDPKHPTAYNNLGVVFVNLKKPREAAQAFSAGIAVNPQDIASKVHLAHLSAIGGQLEQGLQLFRDVLQRDPRQVEILLEAVKTLTRGNRTAEAIAVLRVGAEAAPKDLRVIVPLTQMLATSTDPKLRDPKAAIRLADQILATPEGTKSALGLYAAALAYQSDLQRDRAIELAEAALAISKAEKQSRLAEQIERLLAALRGGEPVAPSAAPQGAPAQKPE